MNPVRQITNYLKSQGFSPEYDKDSFTLFVESQTDSEDIQSRFYYDLDMKVLSCQAIYTEDLPKENYYELCVLANLLNEAIGFGSFIILDRENLIFEINHLTDSDTIMPDDVLDKLSMIPSEALFDHINAFKEVAAGKMKAEEAFKETTL